MLARGLTPRLHLICVECEYNHIAKECLVYETRGRIIVRLGVPQAAAGHTDALVVALADGHLYDDLVPRQVALSGHGLAHLIADRHAVGGQTSEQTMGSR